MQKFTPILKNDYDIKVKVGKYDIFCYSEKKLKEVYKDKEYGPKIIGDARKFKREVDEKGSAKKKKPKKEPFGSLEIQKGSLKVFEVDSQSRIRYKRSGYVCVGGDTYVRILTDRLYFFLWTFGLLAALILLALLLWKLLIPEEVTPDNPLPPPDQWIVPDDDGGETAKPSENGGGSLSMIYTLEAKLDLSAGEIEIYFKNPSASNHDVVLEFYVLSGENEYLIATSGRLPAGYGLTKLTLAENAPALQEGTYQGMYRLLLYNPVTGERANVQPEIPEVVITVTK